MSGAVLGVWLCEKWGSLVPCWLWGRPSCLYFCPVGLKTLLRVGPSTGMCWEMQFQYPIKAKHWLWNTGNLKTPPLKEYQICLDKRSINKILVNNCSLGCYHSLSMVYWSSHKNVDCSRHYREKIVRQRGLLAWLMSEAASWDSSQRHQAKFSYTTLCGSFCRTEGLRRWCQVQFSIARLERIIPIILLARLASTWRCCLTFREWGLRGDWISC